MEPLLIILIPGVFGGLILAWLIATRRHKTPSFVVPRRLSAPSPALINMANIKVEGIGGLGMVAAVVAVAIADPRIRLAIIVAGLLGTGLAFVLIGLRRRSGGMPSSGDSPDDRSTLHLDSDRRTHRAGDPRHIDDVGRSEPRRVLGVDRCLGPV